MTSILRFPTMLRKMWSGGEVQDWLDANQELKDLVTQRDEGLAREADLREALRVAETYVQTAFARAQQKDKLGRKLPADHPISADLSRVLAALASPGCTDGEKSDGCESR